MDAAVGDDGAGNLRRTEAPEEVLPAVGADGVDLHPVLGAAFIVARGHHAAHLGVGIVEVGEVDHHPLLRVGEELVRAEGAGGVVGGVAGRVEFALLLPRRAHVAELALPGTGLRSGDLVVRLEPVVRLEALALAGARVEEHHEDGPLGDDGRRERLAAKDVVELLHCLRLRVQANVGVGASKMVFSQFKKLVQN